MNRSIKSAGLPHVPIIKPRPGYPERETPSGAVRYSPGIPGPCRGIGSPPTCINASAGGADPSLYSGLYFQTMSSSGYSQRSPLFDLLSGFHTSWLPS